MAGGPTTARLSRRSLGALGESVPRGALHVAVLYALPAIAVVAALRAWRGVSYWEFSEGAYALTARMLLEGASLYDQVLAAQPPLLFYAGAAVLAVDDSLEALRAALALPLLVTGLLVALAVWRLTQSRPVAVATGLAALVTPWTLHEQTLLMPETLAAPLLMAGALLASSGRRAKWGGAAAAVAASCKLAFLLPLAAVALASRSRARYVAGAAVAGGLLWAGFLALHGAPLFDNVVRAQWDTGRHSARLVAGLWAQAGWNLAPLLLLAALVWPLRHRACDPWLARSLAGLAAGSVALLITLVKHGSYLNVLALAEPPLVALAGAGLCWLWRERRSRAGAAGAASVRPRRVLALGSGSSLGVAAILAALLAAQSVSLLASPGRPGIFARPLSEASHGWTLSSDGVQRSVRLSSRRGAAARPELRPFIAFLARRSLPGGQPDRFILQHAAIHSDVLRATLAEVRAERAGGSGRSSPAAEASAARRRPAGP